MSRKSIFRQVQKNPKDKKPKPDSLGKLFSVRARLYGAQSLRSAGNRGVARPSSTVSKRTWFRFFPEAFSPLDVGVDDLDDLEGFLGGDVGGEAENEGVGLFDDGAGFGVVMVGFVIKGAGEERRGVPTADEKA